jgi:hypothetical protein
MVPVFDVNFPEKVISSLINHTGTVVQVVYEIRPRDISKRGIVGGPKKPSLVQRIRGPKHQVTDDEKQNPKKEPQKTKGPTLVNVQHGIHPLVDFFSKNQHDDKSQEYQGNMNWSNKAVGANIKRTNPIVING